MISEAWNTDTWFHSQWLTWLAKAAIAVLLVDADSMDARWRHTLIQVVLTQRSAEPGTTVTSKLCPIACARATILTWRRGAWICFFLTRLACVTWKHKVKISVRSVSTGNWRPSVGGVACKFYNWCGDYVTTKMYVPLAVRILTGRASDCSVNL